MVYYKGCKSRIAKWKRPLGQGMGEGCSELPYLLWLCRSPKHLEVFTNSEFSEPCCLGVFVEVSFHRHGWLDHWALVIYLSPTPLPSRAEGWFGMLQPSLITWLFLWPQPSSWSYLAPPPHPKCHLISINPSVWKGLLVINKKHSYHSGNWKDLGTLCQKQETKSKYLFFIIPYYKCVWMWVHWE